MDDDKPNPYRPSSTDGADFHPSGLECPYCSHRYPLTMARYILEPTDSHRCPACGETAVLQKSDQQWTRILWIGVFNGLVGFPLIAATYYFLGEIPAIALGVVYLFGLLEEDRRYDAKRGLSKKSDR